MAKGTALFLRSIRSSQPRCRCVQVPLLATQLAATHWPPRDLAQARYYQHLGIVTAITLVLTAAVVAIPEDL